VIESHPLAVRSVRGRWRSGARFIIRIGLRAVVESLYLFTAPVIAIAGLILVPASLCAGMVVSLVPGTAPVVARLLAPARWYAGLELWRIAKVRATAVGAKGARRRHGRTAAAAVPDRPMRSGRPAAMSDPELWLDVVHAATTVPIALVTAVVTGLWWFIGVAGATTTLRQQLTGHIASPGSLRPMTLYLGSAHSHIGLSLGLTSTVGRLTFGTVVGLLMLATLPLATMVCVAIQAGLGQALLSDGSALHRRIRGLEQERDTARAQTVAAVTAEATALRRLERDIHDGPQQRLVRLALELGRAQHNFDRKPEAVRQALAEALVQTQEALDELRALSRGIAPPILVDRGLGEALGSLAARSAVPVELDVGPVHRRPDAAVETAAYFVVAEALTNVAKHSHAGGCVIGLRHGKAALRVWVRDDGVGGAALAKGHGLRGLDDRLHALGGRLSVTSPEGGPTMITAELPCG
jgi:signal transduction histidine kinase